MRLPTPMKLALAGSGVILFGVGIRSGSTRLRWLGLCLVAVAWLMRFVKDRKGT